MFVFACGCDLSDTPRSSVSVIELRGVMRENKLKTGQNQYHLLNSLVAFVHTWGVYMQAEAVCVYLKCDCI